MAKMQIGLIGFGYWGPNLARNINANPRCILCCIADLNSERREIAGNMASPALVNKEALTEELDYLLDCIEAGQEPFNNGEAGHRVVEILEAADQSLKNSGKLIELLP